MLNEGLHVNLADISIEISTYFSDHSTGTAESSYTHPVEANSTVVSKSYYAMVIQQVRAINASTAVLLIHYMREQAYPRLHYFFEVVRFVGYSRV